MIFNNNRLKDNQIDTKNNKKLNQDCNKLNWHKNNKQN